MGNNTKRNYLEIILKSAKQIKRPLEPKCFVEVERSCNLLFHDSTKTDRSHQVT